MALVSVLVVVVMALVTLPAAGVESTSILVRTAKDGEMIPWGVVVQGKNQSCDATLIDRNSSVADRQVDDEPVELQLICRRAIKETNTN